MGTLKFKTNINCGSCIKSVTPALNGLEDIDLWKVDTDNPDKILEIKLDDEVDNESENKLKNKEAIINAVKNAGFSIEEI